MAGTLLSACLPRQTTRSGRRASSARMCADSGGNAESGVAPTAGVVFAYRISWPPTAAEKILSLEPVLDFNIEESQSR